MATRETATQRKTRIGMLLADFESRSKELNKLSAIVKGLKEQVREVAEGKYGDWERTSGTAREIPDNAAIRAGYAARGETIPMKLTEAPIVVKFVGK